MGFIKRHLATFVLVAILLVGLAIIAYPTFSDWYNQFHQSRAITTYNHSVEDMDAVDYDAMLDSAHAYNERLLLEHPGLDNLSSAQKIEYERELDVTGTGIMAYIDIPKIHCQLPIYHGTDEAVIQIAVGHIPGSSLPVGGESTHSIISSHRGLTSARLFTDLDQLEEGDTFVIHTLNENMAYEVDQIRVVLPNDLSQLGIVEGEDLCTLVTCTPYGINSHRLLVRGHRVPYDAGVVVTPDATQIDTVVVAPVVAVPLLIILLVWLLVSTRKPRITMSKDEIREQLQRMTSGRRK